MIVEKGSAFLLKVSNGEDEPEYITIAGLRTTQMSVNGDPVSVAGAGVFVGSDAEQRIKNHALSGTIDAYEMIFQDGSRIRGDFLVTRMDYSGDYNGERSYTLSLESSGEVTQ